MWLYSHLAGRYEVIRVTSLYATAIVVNTCVAIYTINPYRGHLESMMTMTIKWAWVWYKVQNTHDASLVGAENGRTMDI
jgi:hypothetical protein